MITTGGERWSYEEGILSMFGLRGQKIGPHYYLGYGPADMCVSTFESLTANIRQKLNIMEEKYGADKVARIVVNEFLGFQLYFENAFLATAITDHDEPKGSLAAPMVANRLTRQLVIIENPPVAISYYDLSGCQLR